MKASIILKISLLFLFSCQSYFKFLDGEKNYSVIEEDFEKKVCTQNSLNLISENYPYKEEFLSFLSEKKLTSFGDQIIAWSLYQAKVRPDINLKHARFSFIIGNDKNYQYLDYKNSKGKTQNYYFYEGLNYLAKNYSKSGLKKITALVNQYFKQVKVSKTLEIYFSKYSSNIMSDKLWYKKFTKGNNTLKSGESFRSFDLSLPKKFTNQIPQTPLFDYFVEDKTSQDIKCNQDLNLYKKQIYLTQNSFNISNASFGLTKNRKYFLASLTLQDTGFKSGVTSKITSSVCFIKKPDHRLLVYSLPSIDPGQHIFNLINYEVYKTKSLAELDEYIRFPRHIFVTNPNKLLFESNRGTKSQLQQFLNLNFPLYHANRIGHLWSLKSNAKKVQTVLDPRWDSQMLCTK
ncbi:MAG: hypothetical protein GY909_12885 [Oligoflexia bacterium]|nr:hypothetical protein [Oligoflexia bacterium]